MTKLGEAIPVVEEVPEAPSAINVARLVLQMWINHQQTTEVLTKDQMLEYQCSTFNVRASTLQDLYFPLTRWHLLSRELLPLKAVQVSGVHCPTSMHHGLDCRCHFCEIMTLIHALFRVETASWAIPVDLYSLITYINVKGTANLLSSSPISDPT